VFTEFKRWMDSTLGIESTVLAPYKGMQHTLSFRVLRIKTMENSSIEKLRDKKDLLSGILNMQVSVDVEIKTIGVDAYSRIITLLSSGTRDWHKYSILFPYTITNYTEIRELQYSQEIGEQEAYSSILTFSGVIKNPIHVDELKRLEIGNLLGNPIILLFRS